VVVRSAGRGAGRAAGEQSNVGDWQKKFDGRLDCPGGPWSDQQFMRLPARRGVVALLAQAGQVVLLTTSANIRARLRGRLAQPQEDERKKAADLRQITRTVLWKLTTGHFETDLCFLQLARAIYPGRWASLLAWRLPWWVKASVEDDYPHLARTRKVSTDRHTYIGPFSRAREAEGFIGTVQDAFDLCRDIRCLRQSPNAQPCPYLQMRACLGVCCGRVSMARYRQAVARAADFAAGQRGQVRQELTRRMRAQAKRLAFEQAAATKKRLARLAELDSPRWGHLATLDQFRFLLVQPGPGRRQVKVFFVDRARIARGKPLDYPLDARQVNRAVERMRRHLAGRRVHDAAEQWLLALTAHYLLGSERRRGLMLRWHDQLGPDDLARAVEASAEALRLKSPSADRREPPSEVGEGP